MSDARYSTSAWQRTRKAVLRRDGYACRIRGPRCTGRATTVHHVVPSSQAPHLFFADSNLISSCAACNYSGGARTASQNRRRRIEQLEQVIADQHQQIQELIEKLTEYEKQRPAGEPSRKPAQPAIY